MWYEPLYNRFYGISTFVGYLMPNPFFFTNEQFYFKVIQLSISTQFSSIWPIDKTHSGATSQDQRKPETDANDAVLHIPQSSSSAETSLSDCLVWYPHSVGVVLPLCRSAVGKFYSPSRLGYRILLWVGFYPSAEVQSVYSIAPHPGRHWTFKWIFTMSVSVCYKSTV